MNQSIVLEDEASQIPIIALPIQYNHQPIKTCNLKNIIQLTEENDTNHNQGIDKRPGLTKTTSLLQKTCKDKMLSCLKAIRNLFTRKQKQNNTTPIETFNHYIHNIKHSKQKIKIILPPQKDRRKVLVLDLDETLIFSTYIKREHYDFETEVMMNGEKKMIYTIERFGLESFLFEMSKYYEIVVFTASHKDYANKIIDKIDRKRRIEHRLYREHCVVYDKTTFLKNIRILGREMEDIVIVDDNAVAGSLQPDNFYQIQSFKGNPKDRQLIRLAAFLKYLYAQTEFLPINTLRKQFQELQINVSDRPEGHFKQIINVLSTDAIKRRKSYLHHHKKNSELQNLSDSKWDEQPTEATASQFATRA